MPTNQAAWLMAKQAKPLEIRESPMPEPGPNEVVIRNHAVAINPADWIVQQLGIVVREYPKVIGDDPAGEVTAVGAGVTRFRPGDRVVASVMITGEAGSDGAFQLYVKTPEHYVARIPDALPFRAACVLPLGMNTAASALYLRGALELPFPTVPAAPPTGTVLVVWAGSSSVGSCAVQLAVASGFAVATTASPRNHEHCRSLGATWVFDHTRESVVDDVVAALEGKQVVGVMDAWSRGDSLVKAGAVAARVNGPKFLQTVMVPGMKAEGVPEELRIGYGVSNGLPAENAAVPIWGDWVPHALAAGTLKCKPEPLVVGKGLESIQVALDKGAEGYSGAKLVVELV